MCQGCVAKQQDSLMVGLSDRHVEAIERVRPKEDRSFINAVHEAATDALTPHLPLLPMFAAMYRFLQEERYGVLSEYKLIRVPLSIIPQNKKRYRTPIVSLLHETVLSFRMSEHTVNMVNAAARRHGVCILYLCSCGVVMGKCEDVARFQGSPAHRSMDLLRSTIDAEGNPVVDVLHWNEIPSPNMDIAANGSEIELFEDMSDLLMLAAKVQRPEYPWLDIMLSRYIGQPSIKYAHSPVAGSMGIAARQTA
jgi:hypothetical protein